MYLLAFYKTTLINIQHMKFKYYFEKDGLLYTSKTNIQKVLVYNIHSVINNDVKK